MRGNGISIGNKIRLGLGIILGLLAISGLVTYKIVGRIKILSEKTQQAAREDDLLGVAARDHLKWLNAVSDLFLDGKITHLQVETDDHNCKFGKWLYSEQAAQLAKSDPQIAQLLDQIKEPHHKLHESAKQIGNLYKQIDRTFDAVLAERWIDHLNWTNELSQAILSGKPFTGSQDPRQCAFGRWYEEYQTGDLQLAGLLKRWEQPHESLHFSAKSILDALGQGDKETALRIYEQETLPALHQLSEYYEESMGYIDGMVENNQKAYQVYEQSSKKFGAETSEHLAALHDILEAKTETFQGEEKSFHSMVSSFIVVAMVISLIIGILLAFFLSRHITVTLQDLIQSLSQGANGLFTTSTQISTSSRQLAEAASEQASSLEETSSALEEITSMTKNNADHAHQANQLMGETKSIVKTASQSMREMDQSMREISSAGEEIGKIIKTIDEIAFQTNLLALNAAVEAARAGEAGKGFAVVADEVRNLAQRTAEAAKNTSTMIEDTVRKINDGSELARRTFDAFEKVTDSSSKVGDLVSEIAAASKEQSQGIDQVNIAISQMDKVTQQNAGNAEESASAAESIHKQSDGLRGLVAELIRLIGGQAHHHRPEEGRKTILSSASRMAVGVEKPMPKAVIKGEIERRGKFSQSPSEGKLVRPEQVIPFDEDKFDDFNG